MKPSKVNRIAPKNFLQGAISIQRAKFLLENRGGPQNLLPVIPEFGAGNAHENGINFQEFDFLCKLIEEVNCRLEDVLLDMCAAPFSIDLVGLLTLVSDHGESIAWHKRSIIQGEMKTTSGEISVSEIPNSVLVYASRFFAET